MQLVYRNSIISTDLYTILIELKSKLFNGKLKDIRKVGTDISVTCPFHSDGKELTPDCHIYCGEDKDKLVYGTFHCFACGESGSFAKFVGGCFDKDEAYGKKWLTDNYGSYFDDREVKLEEIKLSSDKKQTYLDESILDDYLDFHPYMLKRKLKPEVCKLFKVKYDDLSKTIVFPVWDANGNLLFLTRRSINTKEFRIPPNVKKPVYLLNSIIKNKVDSVIVVESQINALTCFSYGLPAVAMFGTGSDEQYSILNKSPIRRYILMFDGDSAGDKAINRFLSNIRDDVLVDIVRMPRGKDVNDLTVDEFYYLLKVNNIDYSSMLISI